MNNLTKAIRIPHQIRISGGEQDEVARALHLWVRKVHLMTYEMNPLRTSRGAESLSLD